MTAQPGPIDLALAGDHDPHPGFLLQPKDRRADDLIGMQPSFVCRLPQGTDRLAVHVEPPAGRGLG
jgi:hypothetical protein